MSGPGTCWRPTWSSCRRPRRSRAQNVSIQVAEGKVKVGTANVTATDIKSSNGVIHVIDSVMLPEGDGSRFHFACWYKSRRLPSPVPGRGGSRLAPGCGTAGRLRRPCAVGMPEGRSGCRMILCCPTGRSPNATCSNPSISRSAHQSMLRTPSSARAAGR